MDYNRDGLLDLFVSHYVVFDFHSVPATGVNPDCNFKGVPVYYGPRGLHPERCQLYRNNGDGTFTDVTKSAGIDRAMPTYGLTAVAADYLGTGSQDIYVASDSTPSLLFQNKPDGSFVEQGLELGVAVNEDGKEQAGMGLGVGDFNTDGALDLLKTHFSEDTSVLYRNLGRGGFEDATLHAGLGVETRYVGWGAGIQDFDNDGLPGSFLGDRQRLSGSGKIASRLSVQDPACLVPESGKRQVRGVDSRRAWDCGGSFQPRRGFRRFR